MEPRILQELRKENFGECSLHYSILLAWWICPVQFVCSWPLGNVWKRGGVVGNGCQSISSRVSLPFYFIFESDFMPMYFVLIQLQFIILTFQFWIIFAKTKGICGNTYSVFSEPDSISVGNGASTLGLLGAIYVDLITSILSQSKEQGSTLNPIDENCFVRSAVVSSGMLIGVIVTCILQGNFPEKDWSVLYGGMIAGILCGSIWNIFTVKFDLGMKWYYCTALTIVPLLLSGLFCLQMLRWSRLVGWSNERSNLNLYIKIDPNIVKTFMYCYKAISFNWFFGKPNLTISRNGSIL